MLMENTDRLEQVRKYIGQNGRVRISQIKSEFGVSTATARRDLDTLAREGKIQRVHGGAVLVEMAPPEPPVLQRMNEQSDEKARIGAATAALIHDGETVFLGAGTTVLEVAKCLQNHHRLTVITNSLLVQNALANHKDMNLVFLGGTFRNTEYTVYGYLTEQDASQLNADKVILGIRAISLEQGLTNDFLPEISTDRALLKVGREVILTADHTKFHRISTAQVSELTAVQTIVTDNQAPTDLIASIREMGIRVIIA